MLEFVENQVLSTIDLTSSYWQIKIAEDHRKYTGFAFEGKTYFFNVLPFGLCTSVGSFVRGLAKILGPEVESFVIPYVDDLLIYSVGTREHLDHLRVVFQKLRGAHFTVRLSKSKFACESVTYLGHIISSKGVAMDPGRIKSIQDFPTPVNIKQLRSFLGLINFDRRFLRDFSNLTIPLLKLLKKGQAWQWGEKEDDVFGRIKEAFLQVTILKHPNPHLPYYVQADASYYGVGAVLFQLNENDGSRGVIAYVSRTLQSSELRYTVTEKELLAVVHALRQWRVFILGRPLIILIDHKSLSFLQSCRLLNTRLTRWILYLQEYDFEIRYCRGSENVVADALSRAPIGFSRLPDFPESEEIFIAVLRIKIISSLKLLGTI